MIKIGLLGCGNVGQIIAKHAEGIEIVALFDMIAGHAQELTAFCRAEPYTDFDAFIAQDFDLVVEAASVGAVRSYGEAILEAGKDLVLLSGGALADEDFREELVETARRN
ncbi:MAG: aspartate dehydrogenase, partial [Methanomicrobiaceae archaeon]|nr:aspartate dehydrogenase [Methanomicrobiaceae archaeon]